MEILVDNTASCILSVPDDSLCFLFPHALSGEAELKRERERELTKGAFLKERNSASSGLLFFLLVFCISAAAAAASAVFAVLPLTVQFLAAS